MGVFQTRVSFIIPMTVAIATFAVLTSADAAGAVQTPSGPRSKSDATSLPLSRALERLGTASRFLILADSTVAYERVSETEASFVAPVDAASRGMEQREAAVEAQIERLTRTLPVGTVWAKLYLPAPTSGKSWRGDDVAAYAFAQARLFGPVGAKAPVGKIEILGRLVETAKMPEAVSALGLKPVYLLTNAKKCAA